MKKTIIIFLAVLLPSFASAQLRVDSVGAVKVDNKLVVADSLNNNTAFLLTKPLIPTITNKGLDIMVGNDELASFSDTKAIGLTATAGGGVGAYNFGIIGNLSSTDMKGAAILGTRGNPNGLNVSKSYAGYFDGPVKITTYADAPLTDIVSNATASSAISSWNALSIISKITPIYWNETIGGRNLRDQFDEETIQEFETSSSQDPNRSLTRKHYNVRFSNNGPFDNIEFYACKTNLEYGANYNQLIPVLLKAIKELKGQLDSLSNRNFGESETMSRGTTSSLESGYSENIMPSMSQNIPNPFSERTDIAITLPESVRKAVLYIYDMTGKQLEQHEVAGRGETTMTIYADRMDNGMYIYALVADGRVVTSKKMIVAK